jgi:hypothetical protein
MYLMYVDESGDSGLANSPTDYFVLSGIVVHEREWRSFMDTLLNFKRTMNALYGLPVRAELHAYEFVRKKVYGLPKHVRLAILRHALDELAKIPSILITNVVVDKTTKGPGYDVFEAAWRTLFQRFENTLNNANFPGGFRDDYGLVFTDVTNGTKLQKITRKMAVWNPIPNSAPYAPGYRNLPVVKVIEDPHGQNSDESMGVQMADVCAYFLHQRSKPNSYVRKQGARFYINRLAPVLNRHASRKNGWGIVEL